jgi:hypothetical protein
MRHLKLDTVEQYSMGVLTDSEVSRVENHLLLCSTCRERIDEFDAFRHAVKDAFSADVDELEVTIHANSGGI